MIAWPTELVRDIAARKCVLFVGAGISRNSKSASGKRPPTWISFLQDAVATARKAKKLSANDAKILRTLVNERDLLTVCDVIKSVLSPAEFTGLVRKEYLTPGYKAAEVHEHIWNLDCRIILTPNFDLILDGHAAVASKNSALVKTHTNDDVAESLRLAERLIVKTHGSVSAPHDLIFTRAEYASARAKYRAFYSLIESLLRTHTFLFLGCGLDDPDIRLLLENYTFDFTHSRKHHFVLPSDTLSKTILQVLSNSLNLDFLPYSPLKNHKDLTASLKALVQKVEQARLEMASTQSW